MKEISATDAAKNFGAAIKTVDQDGALVIKRKGGREYVLQSRGAYEGLDKSGVLYGKCGNDFVKIEYCGDGVMIYQMYPCENGLLYYRIIDVPADLPTVSRKGRAVIVSGNIEDYDGEDQRRRRNVMYGMEMLDIKAVEEGADMSMPPEIARVERFKMAHGALEEFKDVPEDSLLKVELEICNNRRKLTTPL